jgi:TRAP-type C4-dicarboxylate transport system permease small subunit
VSQQDLPAKETGGGRGSSAAKFLFVSMPYLISGTFMLAAVAINFANIVARYVFNEAIFWTEEVLGFLMIYSVFLSAVTIAFNADNINMDLFYARFPKAVRRGVNMVILAAFIASSAFMAVQSYKVVSLHLRNGTKSVAAAVPMVVPHTALLIGFTLTALALCWRWRTYVDRGSPDEQHSSIRE